MDCEVWTVLNELTGRDIGNEVWRDRKRSEIEMADECRDLRIVPYFEHQDVKSYIVSQSDGLSKNEFERGYQYFSDGYVFGVKGNHSLSCQMLRRSSFAQFGPTQHNATHHSADVCVLIHVYAGRFSSFCRTYHPINLLC